MAAGPRDRTGSPRDPSRPPRLLRLDPTARVASRPPCRVASALVAIVGSAILIAGCGASTLTVAGLPGASATGRHVRLSRSSSDGVVGFLGGAANPAQQAQAQLTQLKFSRCMRAHGVPNFPDPTTSVGGGFGLAFGASGIDPAAPLFRVAQRSCIAIITHQRRVVAR